MFSLPIPDLQIDFAVNLHEIRDTLLQEALGVAVKELDISVINDELVTHAPNSSIRMLAAHGLRGELVFPVPSILHKNPKLLGYYRLLYGYSQKEFYTTQTGFSRFQTMEKRGKLTHSHRDDLSEMCKALCVSGSLLIEGIGARRLSKSLLDDLTLLTLGPQLRGGANVKKGAAGIIKVFDAIHDIVQHATVNTSEVSIEVLNAAGRKVLIEFAADPDIIIREDMGNGVYSQKIAIEVKAGSDFSNIHNRIGEAEKSHQKAKKIGYVECWTVVNVDRINIAMAKQESPSTNRFYRISDLVKAKGSKYQDFKTRVISLTGIRTT